MKKIIGIGSAFVDFFFDANEAFLSSYGLKAEDDRLFDVEKVTKAIFSTFPILAKSPGGSTINTLAVLKTLGMPVSYAGILGKGEDTKTFFQNLTKINFSAVIEKGSMSQCACLLTHQRTKRTFVSTMNPHDNDFFDCAETLRFDQYSFCHITQFFLRPEESLKKLGEFVQSITCPISFSPGVVYANFGLSQLLPILEKTHVVFLAQSELRVLLPGTMKNASRTLLRYGPEIIVITMGEKGALITTKDEQFISKAEKVTTIVDTTGAGDAFAAGFLYGILEKKSLKESAAFANKIAAKSVTDFGLRWLKSL